MKMCSKLNSKYIRRLKASPALNTKELRQVHHRERLIMKGITRHYKKAHVALIGAGGLGGNIGLGLVRKGIGKSSFYDGDIVVASNLGRQRYNVNDLGKPKAFQLVKNLVREAIVRSELVGIKLYFEEALAEGLVELPDVFVCCPDNDEVREFTARFGLKFGIPVVTTGLGTDADYGYVHIYDGNSNGSCWSCLKKGNYGAKSCGAVPSNINLVLTISGLVLSALDSIICKTPLPWNYRRISLSGNLPEISTVVPVWSDCPVCYVK